MPIYKESNSVDCPFYLGETREKIRCEGIVPGSWIHFTFRDGKAKHKYERTYCCERYRACKLFQLLALGYAN